MGKICLKNSTKGAWTGIFKSKRQNLYIAISPELLIGLTSDLRIEFRTWKTSWVVRHYLKANTIWLTAAILKIDMTSYFRSVCSDLDEIRHPRMQNFADYGEIVEIETGSIISIWHTFCFSIPEAVNWDMSTKFGLLIDFDLLKTVTSTNTTSTNTKPEVVLSGRGRHLEKWIWRHIFATGAPIWTKFCNLIRDEIQITAKWSRSKPEVEFQYGGRLFFKNGSSYISAVNWDMSAKFSLLTDFDLLKTVFFFSYAWRQWHQQIRNQK